MSQFVTDVQSQNRTKQVAILVGGDALVLLLFTWIGRGSHSLSVVDIGAGLFTALPFLIAWFGITPWFGLFRAEVSQSWRKVVPRLLLAWAIGGPLALVLRTLFLGRPLSTGIIPSFAIVALSFTTLFMLIWRLGYAWWASRQDSNEA